MEADVQQFKWQRSAACNGVPSYVFFPDEQLNPGFKPDETFRNKTFKDFCGSCRVKSICKEFAVLHDMHGIWGGTTENDRSKKYDKEERDEMREYKRDSETNRYKPLYGHS